MARFLDHDNKQRKRGDCGWEQSWFHPSQMDSTPPSARCKGTIPVLSKR